MAEEFLYIFFEKKLSLQLWGHKIVHFCPRKISHVMAAIFLKLSIFEVFEQKILDSEFLFHQLCFFNSDMSLFFKV